MIATFRRYLLAMASYIIYLLCWLRLIQVGYNQETAEMLGEYSTAYGETAVYLFFFNVLITILYSAVLVILAVIYRNDRSFFLKLLLAALLPAFLITIVGV